MLADLSAKHPEALMKLQPTQTWSWVPEEKGKHPYVCAYHPTMVGKVVVK